MHKLLNLKSALILTAIALIGGIAYASAPVIIGDVTYFQAETRLNGGTKMGTPLTYSYNTAAITAGATQTQVGATLLSQEFNNVSVVGTAGDGVRLPVAYKGAHYVVQNTDAADALSVYPATSGTIDALSANASISVPAGQTMEFWATGTTGWQSSGKLCVASGAGSFTTLAASGAATLSSTVSLQFGAATAGATQTQAGATALSKVFNKVTTGTGNDGVALPAGSAAQCLMISNISANALKVYGALADDDTIDGGSADASVTQAASTKSIWYCTSNGVAWTSFQ